ncbi:MAG: hypothetical protein IJ752_00545 [Alphaproteobacteria bacterium]|nr:hypothetical protein [Alphaproteobacteria bacterium]
MKKIFIMFLAFLLSGNALAQTEGGNGSSQTGNTQAVDPNTPAPASLVQIKIPHSERTKGNILDAALDFLFIRFFNRYPGVGISYDFFEIDSQNNLNFKNFKAKIALADVQGTVVVSNVLVDFSEFMETVKSSKAEISKITFKDISGDLQLIKNKAVSETQTQTEKTEESRRRLKISAQEIMLKDFLFAFWGKNSNSDWTSGDILAQKILVTLSNPTEKYAANSIEVKKISFPQRKVANLTFSSAELDGKQYDNRQDLLKAMKRQ